MAIGTEISKLFVRIGADISELKTGLAQAGSEVNKAASNIKNAGNKFSSAGRALTVGVTAPIIALGGFALKASIDFESAFAGVRKTVDATEPEFAQLRQGIRDMAKEMPLSASKIAEVAEAAGQLGVQKGDVLAFTKTMVKLGTATNLSATEAATGFARLANIMRVPLKDVDKLADVLVNLGNKGASTEKEILDMALRIAGAAQQIGISAQDVLAFANALSSVGIEAEAGGSAISRTFVEIAEAVSGLEPTPEHLQDIADATRDVSDASDNLASAQRGVRDAGEGVRDAQRGVRDATEGVADAQRNSRNAAEALRDAQANLTRAYRDQRQAQLDARRETLSVMEAQQGLREVQAQAGSQALELRSAQLAVAEAQRRLAEASKKGGLEQAQAVLGVQQAQSRLQQVIAQGPRYSLDLQNAQLRLQEAQNRVGQSAQQQAQKITDAQRNVRNATEGVNDARRNERNAAEGVADANRNLRNAYEGVGDAQKGAVRASQDLQDAQKKLNELTDGSSSKLKLFAEVAGMSVEEFSNLFQKDAKSAVLAFVEGLGRIKESGGDVFGTLKKLGLEEVRQRDALLRLAGAGNVLRQSFEDAASASGALDREFKEKAETSAAQLAIKWNEITDSMIELGDALKPIFMELLAAAQPFFDAVRIGAEAFANLPGPVQKVIVGLALLAAIIGPLLMAIGAMAGGVTAIIGVMGALGISFAGGSIAVTGLAAAFGTLILAALPWIALAAALALAGYLIYKNWEEIQGVFEDVGDELVGAGKSVLRFLKGNWRQVATLISGPFLPIVALATDAFGIRSAIEGALSSMVGSVGGLAGQIASAISNAFTGAVGTAGGLAGSLVATIGGAITSVLDTIKSNFNAETIGEAFGAFLFAPLRVIRMGLEAIIPVLVSFFGTTLPNFFTKTIPAVASAAATLGKAIVTGIVNAIASLPGFIASAASTIASGALNLGKAVMNGILTGLTTYVGLVKTFWTSTLPGVITGGTQLIVSAAVAVGKAIITGISSGINGAISLITAAPRVIGNAFISGFNFIKNDVYNLGRDIVKGLWEGIKSMTGWLYDQVKNFFKGLIKSGKDAVGAKSPSTMFRAIGEDIVDGLALGLRGAAKLVVPAPVMAGSTATVGIQTATRIPGLNASAQEWVSGTSPLTGPQPRGLAEVSGGGGDFARGVATTKTDGLNIEINGPVKVQNIGRRQDAKGALGDLAFGVKGQLNRRGVYA